MQALFEGAQVWERIFYLFDKRPQWIGEVGTEIKSFDKNC
jgi:hypothetical protein